jgi:hypothetical protein
MATAPASGTLSPEAQHVIDCLEAHLNAVKLAVASGTPGAVSDAKGFADAALQALQGWGLKIRGNLQALKAPLPGESAVAPAGTLARPVTGARPAAAAPAGAAPAGRVPGARVPAARPAPAPAAAPARA